MGRYCEYKNIDTDRSSEFDTFDAYLPTLVLECNDGEPGMFTWTPDENTPDTVYYQVIKCAFHFVIRCMSYMYREWLQFKPLGPHHMHSCDEALKAKTANHALKYLLVENSDH